MKLNQHNNTLQTNVQTETQNFGIGNAHVVIDILRNRLYENKKQTCTQEYLSNARDAMREASKDDHAFDITVPTRMNPVFKVRDYGPGISPDRMSNVFVMYGASTKRVDNHQTGGFGIGAKSAWAYTDSFTIVSFVDGVKRTYVAHTGVNNNGRLDLLNETATKEPNGVEIQIAVRENDIEDFANAIKRTVHYWKQRPNVKGIHSIPCLVQGTRLGDVEVIDQKDIPDYIGDDYVMLAVIDGIPYPIKDKLYEKVAGLRELNDLCDKTVIMHFGNGVVEVSASRESIADSDTSINALNMLARGACTLIKNHIKKEFSKCQTTADWFKTYRELNETFDVDNHNNYRGYEIRYGDVHSQKFDTSPEVRFHHVSKYSERQRRNSHRQTIAYPDKLHKDENGKTHFAVGDLASIYYLTQDESVQATNNRLRELLRTQDSVIMVSCSDDTKLQGIANDLGFKDLSQVSFTPRERRKRESLDLQNDEFAIHVINGWPKVRSTSLQTNHENWLYYPVRSEKYDESALKELQDYFKGQGKAYRICGLGDKAVKQVQGDSHFQDLDAYLENLQATPAMIKDAKLSHAKNMRNMSMLKAMPVADPVISGMRSEYQPLMSGNGQNLPKLIKAKVEAHPECVAFLVKDGQLETQLKKYPLLDCISPYNLDPGKVQDIVFYLNTKYNSLKGV